MRLLLIGALRIAEKFHPLAGMLLDLLRSVLPVVAVLSVGVLLITYIPGLTAALPRLFGY